MSFNRSIRSCQIRNCLFRSLFRNSIIRIFVLGLGATLTGCNVLGLLDSKEDPAQSKPVAAEEAVVEEIAWSEAQWAGLYTALAARPRHDAEIISVFSIAENIPYAVSIDRHAEVLLWNLKTGRAKFLLRMPGAARGQELVAALNPQAHRLAVAQGTQIFIFDLALPGAIGGTPVPTQDLRVLKTRVSSLEFQPTGSGALLIGGADGKVYRWRYGFERVADRMREKQKVLERYSGPASVISLVKYHPFGRVFFSTDWSGGLFAWLSYDADVFQGEYDQNYLENRFFAQKPESTGSVRALDGTMVTALDVSPSGEWLALGTEKGLVELWMIRGFRKVASFEAHKGIIRDLGFGKDSASIVTAGRDGRVVRLGIVPDVMKSLAPLFVLKKESEVAIPEVVSLQVVSSTKVLAGSGDGTLLEITFPS